MSRGFGHVDQWVFDLDNTLYPPSCRLFDQVDERMGRFISELLNVDRVEARRVQKKFFHEHGTTLRGLMIEHGVSPDVFLDFVHDIDHSPVAGDEALGFALEQLPGRKVIFTNGTVAHAESVLARIGITHHFDGIFDIVHADYIPKPGLEPYQKFVSAMGIEPSRAAMFEDIARNLEVPDRLGMTTVLVTSPDNEDGNLINELSGGIELAHVHHKTADLAAFLAKVAKGEMA